MQFNFSAVFNAKAANIFENTPLCSYDNIELDKTCINLCFQMTQNAVDVFTLTMAKKDSPAARILNRHLFHLNLLIQEKEQVEHQLVILFTTFSFGPSSLRTLHMYM